MFISILCLWVPVYTCWKLIPLKNSYICGCFTVRWSTAVDSAPFSFNLILWESGCYVSSWVNSFMVPGLLYTSYTQKNASFLIVHNMQAFPNSLFSGELNPQHRDLVLCYFFYILHFISKCTFLPYFNISDIGMCLLATSYKPWQSLMSTFFPLHMLKWVHCVV